VSWISISTLPPSARIETTISFCVTFAWGKARAVSRPCVSVQLGLLYESRRRCAGAEMPQRFGAQRLTSA
jgi:hypothetical protein